MTGRKAKNCYRPAARGFLRRGPFIILLTLIASIVSAEAPADPVGVWIPARPDSVIERIHISGSPLDYIATIDYRCFTAVCSTFQSLIAEGSRPPTFSVRLEGGGPAPMLALRWQSGPPCNHAGSDQNPLVWWTASINPQPGKTDAGAVKRAVCLVHPPAPPSPKQR